MAAPAITHVTVRNGLTLAYVVALINAGLTLVVTFGVHFTTEQQGAIVGFVNVAIMLAARVMHMPERASDGGTVKVVHVPELVTVGPSGASSSGVRSDPAPPPAEPAPAASPAA